MATLAAFQMMGAANQTEGLTSVFTVFNTRTPRLYADIDRQKAEQLGVPVDNIFATLGTYLGSAYINDFNYLGRTYRVTAQADGTFRGKADDVVGEAIGEVAGNALRWRYVLALPVDGKVYHVDFDDWMFLMDDKVMLNRSYMSKWGFNLGDVTLTFVKR